MPGTEPELIDNFDAAAETIIGEFEELNRWRRLGAALWPWVQHWPMCGAASPAVAASVELARLLGEKRQVTHLEQAATEGVAAGVDVAAEWAANDAWLAKKIGFKNAKEVADKIRGLKGQ